MKKVSYELELELSDFWIDERLKLMEQGICIVYATNSDTEEYDPIEAFEPDVDGDWQGVNDFQLDDYEKELNEFSSTVEEHIRELIVDKINELIDRKLLSITDIHQKPLTQQEIKKKVVWVSKEYCDFKENTLAFDKYTNERMPCVNWLCNNPVSASFRVLICELCNIHFLEKGDYR